MAAARIADALTQDVLLAPLEAGVIPLPHQLLKEDSKFLAMEEAAYDSESLLQKLLADHPDLLAGDQIDAEEPSAAARHP